MKVLEGYQICSCQEQRAGRGGWDEKSGLTVDKPCRGWDEKLGFMVEKGRGGWDEKVGRQPELSRTVALRSLSGLDMEGRLSLDGKVLYVSSKVFLKCLVPMYASFFCASILE